MCVKPKLATERTEGQPLTFDFLSRGNHYKPYNNTTCPTRKSSGRLASAADLHHYASRNMNKISKLPWASGPGEILRHGLSLLKRDSDTNRRLAMISIDNAVELMIKTYLGLPKRITGLSITRKEYQGMVESFPGLLDGLENHALVKLDGIDLGTIEWYHRLRNELYHQGNGLTVERNKVEIYAELANLLFKNLFGEEIVPHAISETEFLGEFMAVWVSIERTMYHLAELTYSDRQKGQRINVGADYQLPCARQNTRQIRRRRNRPAPSDQEPDYSWRNRPEIHNHSRSYGTNEKDPLCLGAKNSPVLRRTSSKGTV